MADLELLLEDVAAVFLRARVAIPRKFPQLQLTAAETQGLIVLACWLTGAKPKKGQPVPRVDTQATVDRWRQQGRIDEGWVAWAPPSPSRQPVFPEWRPAPAPPKPREPPSAAPLLDYDRHAPKWNWWAA